MRGQWGLIIGLVVALLITIFAVINMDAVTVNYMFGTAQWPLVIVIISSVLMGAILVGGVGIYQFYKLSSQLKKLQLENEELKKNTVASPKKPIEKKPEINNSSNPKS
ncbi:LapA family protein [Anaerobacillus isosaccharinicus]|uniref:DUF1049 domain-containing protein n=1 Tax=Anaerobacillus isosaccharinicus TaxID=1532552 RepID=A0A1S2KU66_9BACI|nr:lipopolysaccharide assembly protein LapA domain-containing protein [Anaerobacillus isosaccharinicus]MBA5585365.1 DUF1049 domain-containing protein [Anaerobacillus isosaccharinicus]QOY36314.1 DUF1049 domain-containing protein [Anaerobacillus isosaccharinicus]